MSTSTDKALDEATQGNAQQASTAELERRSDSMPLWVGYSSGRRHYIDHARLPGGTQAKFHLLRTWWESRISRKERWTRRWIQCQLPVIAIATLPSVSP